MKKKKWLKWLFLPVITLLLFVFSLELIYRNYWFDFYKAELKGLNTNEILNSNKSKVLVCGDSFSATPQSYVQMLRDSLPQYDIINSAVPGSGILQHSLYLKKRIQKFKPVIFVYQFYVGNDLFDLSHPIGSPSLSTKRKLYWWVSDRIWSIAYLNFRTAGIRYHYYNQEENNLTLRSKEVFSVGAYTKREILNFKAEPLLVENTLYLSEGRKKDMEVFKRKLKYLSKLLGKDCKKYFLIIPHESMVSREGFMKHQLIGAQFQQEVYSNLSMDFPLYVEIDKICSELGFVMVDPLESIRSSATPCYYENDPHFNSKGHQVVGNYLLNKMNIE